MNFISRTAMPWDSTAERVRWGCLIWVIWVLSRIWLMLWVCLMLWVLSLSWCDFIQYGLLLVHLVSEHLQDERNLDLVMVPISIDGLEREKGRKQLN